MRLANLGYTFGLSAAVAMFFGCGGSQPPAAARGAMPQNSAIAPRVAQRPSWMKFGSDPASDDSYTFVSQMWQTSVAAYPTNNRENGGPICSAGPVSFPEGIAIDGSGVLYVVASFPGDKSGIATFGPSCGSAGRTFMSPKGAPLDPTVDGTTLYVTDSDRIEVYDTSKKGSSPIRKLSEGSGIGGIGLAVDSHHDLLWSTLAQPWMGGEVVLFANGQMPGKVLPATRIGHDFPEAS